MASLSFITKIVTTTLVLLLIGLLNIEVTLVSADNQEWYYDWNVTFQYTAPLGVSKQIIVINDEFPGPLLNASTNDVVNINIHNNLDEPFLMTWNGIQMKRNSWQDGVQETNCPISPGHTWTYSFQLKDQIGSYFYFPSLQFHKAAGGYGPIRIQNDELVPVPFPQADFDYDILIGDWYNANYRTLRNALDNGMELPLPDGVLINGLGPNQASMDFEPGATYRLRISNVGLRTTLNFRIQEHLLLLVETEGTYTMKQYYDSLDVHVGQSYSVLVTANNTGDVSFYMLATSRFTPMPLVGSVFIRYSGFQGMPILPPNSGLDLYDYRYSLDQALSIRMDLSVGAARPNPQGSFHYGTIRINRLMTLRNDVAFINGRLRHTVNSVSFVHPDTPLLLADYYKLPDEFQTESIHDTPDEIFPRMGVSVINATYHDFVHVVLQNPLIDIQSWHSDGNNFFVVGMGTLPWTVRNMGSYNMYDAIYRSTVQVYPTSWTAIMIKLDNEGMWNFRSQNAERWYLGQELYIRVRGEGKDDLKNISPYDQAPIPANVLKCGRAASL
ncbi:oxidase [Lithospermum erythrorhizon]|uniref:Oxidase n=1 Tax=Lithospermum erythrorhizon TaxID=34254 RepID=A0AAV3QE28_LITER